MAKTIPHIKRRIPDNENVFYLFRCSPTEYILYDSGMGDPLKRGSVALIYEFLKDYKESINKNLKAGDQPKEIYVWKIERDKLKGWIYKKTMQGVPYSDPPKGTYGTLENILPTSPLKDIGYDPIYYSFSLGNIYYLYDYDMGSPILRSSALAVLNKTIVNHSKVHEFTYMIFDIAPKYKGNGIYWKATLRYNKTLQESNNDIKHKVNEEEYSAKSLLPKANQKYSSDKGIEKQVRDINEFK